MKLYRTPTKVLYLLEMNANYKQREGVQIYCRIQWCRGNLHRFLHDLQIWTFSSWWRPVVKGNEREVLIVLVRLGDVDGPAVILSPESCPSAQHLLSGHHSPHRDKQHTLVLTFLWEREREREREVWAVFISLIWSLLLGGWQPSSHWLHLTDCLYCSYWGWIISYNVYTAAVRIFFSYWGCLIVYTVYTVYTTDV